jgi:hypothetical protein
MPPIRRGSVCWSRTSQARASNGNAASRSAVSVAAVTHTLATKPLRLSTRNMARLREPRLFALVLAWEHRIAIRRGLMGVIPPRRAVEINRAIAGSRGGRAHGRSRPYGRSRPHGGSRPHGDTGPHGPTADDDSSPHDDFGFVTARAHDFPPRPSSVRSDWLDSATTHSRPRSLKFLIRRPATLVDPSGGGRGAATEALGHFAYAEQAIEVRTDVDPGSQP